MTVLTELKSPNSLTERNANICAMDAKYSECSCTEARQQPLEGNGQETVRGEAIQETDLVGDNAEDVDADLQRKPTFVSVANGEGPSVPMTCQVAGVSVPLQDPADSADIRERRLAPDLPTIYLREHQHLR